MLNKFDKTIEDLEKIKITHPNLYNLWKVFLERRKKRMLEILLQFDKILNNIENLPDIDPLSMMLIFDISLQSA